MKEVTVMKKHLFFAAVVIFLLSLSTCSFAYSFLDFLYKDPWGASMKSFKSTMNKQQSKNGETNIVTYYPDISGFNELQLIYVNDKLMGSILMTV